MTQPSITIEIPLDKVEDISPGDRDSIAFSGHADVYVMVNGNLEGVYRFGHDHDPDWHDIVIGWDRE